jgi:hypothetical protein
LPPSRAGLLVALLQAGLLVSLGAVFLLERARLPRAWVRVAPVDPNLPIRGRYVSLALLVPAPRLQPPAPDAARRWAPVEIRLVVRGDGLEALPAPPDSGRFGSHRALVEQRDGTVLARLQDPVAFFIPPDGADPSRRPAGEELWVQVSLPKEGQPRPIQLGVRRAAAPGGAETIRPLPLSRPGG